MLKPLLVFIIIVIAVVAAPLTYKRYTYHLAIDLLEAGAEVLLNGEAVAAEEILSSNLFYCVSIKLSGSNPKGRASEIVITGHKKIKFFVQKDSRDPQLFWLYQGSIFKHNYCHSKVVSPDFRTLLTSKGIGAVVRVMRV